MSAPRTDLHLIAGQPYERTARIIGGALIWPTPEEREARGGVAEYEGGCRIRDLSGNLSTEADGDDLLLRLILTGSDTRALPPLGFYDTFVSDAGPDDTRAVRCLWGDLLIEPTATSSA